MSAHAPGTGLLTTLLLYLVSLPPYSRPPLQSTHEPPRHSEHARAQVPVQQLIMRLMLRSAEASAAVVLHAAVLAADAATPPGSFVDGTAKVRFIATGLLVLCSSSANYAAWDLACR